MSRRTRRHTIGEDLVKGAIAGAVATYVMGRITTFMYDREDRRARKQEDEARDGGTSSGAAAEKGAELVGRRLLVSASGRGPATPWCGAGWPSWARPWAPPSARRSGASWTREWCRSSA